MRDPEHQCRTCGKVWIGLEVDCPYCELTQQPQDNPYIITLDPEQFQCLVDVLDTVYAHNDGAEDGLFMEILRQVHLADVNHVCVDEGGAR